MWNEASVSGWVRRPCRPSIVSSGFWHMIYIMLAWQVAALHVCPFAGMGGAGYTKGAPLQQIWA